MKNNFLLDKDITFLNHGSFGACPKEIFDYYQEKQLELERQPVKYFQKTLIPEINKNKDDLADFLNCSRDDLILLTNATYATNLVINSLNLTENDEVLTTNHEYGACTNAWEFAASKKGFAFKRINFDLPLDDDSILNKFQKNISSKTKVIFLSHISSKTAQLFPIKRICDFAKENNIITVIDAAHSVGHIPLDLKDLGADFYFSNLHKWLYAPKGVAFLYTSPKFQHLVKPLITGWGFGSEREMGFGSDYVDTNQYYGTKDYAAFLSVSRSIEFYKKYNVSELKKECNFILKKYLKEFSNLLKMNLLYENFNSKLMMGIFEIPQKYSQMQLKEILIDKYSVEIPVIEWENRLFIRISFQIYNNEQDLINLKNALKEIFLSSELDSQTAF